MNTYAILLRGINVGGKNKIAMTALKTSLESLGCRNVTTYIQSGNVVAQSGLGAKQLQQKIESALLKDFKLDSPLIKVLVLSLAQLTQVVDNKPPGFGEQPDIYHSDVIFLMGISTQQALPVFAPRDGIDVIWPGIGVVYSQRLSAERAKSRLNKIIGTVPYQSMTIRNWNTTTKLLKIMQEIAKT